MTEQEQEEVRRKSNNIFIWIYTVLAWLFRLFHRAPCYWDELKCHGYTIERKHPRGFYFANREGRRCGKVYGGMDQLMGEREAFAKLELSRLEEGKE